MIDARYRNNYGFSLIENLDYIRDHGEEAFAKADDRRWRCSCGTIFSCHERVCPTCHQERIIPALGGNL